MLTSSFSREELHSVVINSNDLHCPLTFQRYTEENYPITLPCGHTLSIQAFQKVKTRNRACPFCRKPFPMNYTPQKNVLWWNVTQQVQTKHKIYCHKHPHDAAVAICLEEKVYICPDCLQEDKHLLDGVITLKKLGAQMQEIKQKLDRYNEKAKNGPGTGKDKNKNVIDKAVLSRIEVLLQQISILESKGDTVLTARITLIEELMEKSRDLEPDEMYENIAFPAESRKGLVSLENQGQYGFMNAVFQCLSNTSGLTMSFLKNEQLTDMDECAPLTNDSKLASAYGELVNDMWLGTSPDVSPSDLISTIKNLHSQFTGDAHEFLLFFLDALHLDLNKARGAPSFESKDYSVKSDHILAQESWDNHLRRNQSIVQELMHGQFLSRFECADCQRVSLTFDSYTTVSLPLPQPVHTTDHNPSVELAIYFIYDSSLKFPVKIDLEVPSNTTYQEIKDKLSSIVHVPADHIVGTLVQGNNFHGFVDPSIDAHRLNEQPAVLFGHEIPEEIVLEKKPSMKNKTLLTPDYVEKEVPQSSILAKVLIYTEVQPSSKSNEPVSFPRVVKISPSESLRDLHLKVYKKMRRHLLKYFEAEAKKNPIDSKHESRTTRKEEYKGIFPENEPKLWPYQVYIMDKNCQKNAKPTHCLLCKKMECEHCVLPHEDAKLNLYMKKINLDPNELTLKVVFRESINVKSLKLDRCLQLQHENKGNPDSAPKNTTIHDCFGLLTKKYKLDEIGEIWFCAHCKTNKKASKKMEIYRVPQVLIVHLNRFNMSPNNPKWDTSNKINTMIDFPVEGLDLAGVVLEEHKDGAVYDLFAVVNHYDGINGGHYITYVKNFMSGSWNSFDNSKIAQVDSKDIVSSAAYVLFYKKRC